MTDLISTYVDEGRFTDLFVEGLGWDRPRGRPRTLAVTTDSGTLTVEEVATYRGITVWECGEIPDGRGQRLVDREARNASDERLVIFHDGHRQEWRWPQAKDTQGTGASRLVLHEHMVGRPNPALEQRLAQIEIGLDEEGVSVVEVGRRLRRAFDAEKVTNRFYKAFKLQHEVLCDAITGLDDAEEKATTSEVRWYGSLLLNRIMFIYFMQKKGFLDGDLDYLRNRLVRIREMERSDTPGTFYDFYKHFLLPLFHHGLGHPDRANAIDDPAIAALLGDIPYVNGGIFSVHPLEAANEIAVPDAVFESLFDFLDGWQWHLDDRLTGDPNEINPDVLGYIFEQFINNKQQGAYYTKEDVTAYMTNSVLVPVFLDRLEKATGINPWVHLVAQPDRYIWASVAHGCDIDLPEGVLGSRGEWPRPTWDATEPDESLALPGESWWEVVQRRERLEDLRARLITGEIRTANAAVYENVDLLSLAVDVIDAIDSPDDVAKVWGILTGLRVVDPTCGSGAFLFAALVSLEVLYSAVLDAARVHARSTDHAAVRALVGSASRHTSTPYFLLKHIALNNLYGVDLMPEAVEIARLRLFLKLMAQAVSREDIEPLPDLEFNVRTGNILVGAVDGQSIENLATLESVGRVEEVLDRVAEAAATYRAFSDAQAFGDRSTVENHRTAMRQAISSGRETLDEWWFARYSPQAGESDIARYLDVHRPFHWPVEFPEVFSSGGFDVVIGNPPYVRRSAVPYHYSGFETDAAPDIYAPCFERSCQLTASDGRLALIVPVSSQFGDRFRRLREVVAERFGSVWVSTFERAPDSLFGSEVGVRSSIWICGPGDGDGLGVSVTRTHRWVAAFRPVLFESIQYVQTHESLMSPGWVRLASPGLRDLFVKLRTTGAGTLAGSELRSGKFHVAFKGNALYYLQAFIDHPPLFEADGSPGTPTMMSEVRFESEELRAAALALLLTKLAYVWWGLSSDNLNVTKSGVLSTPIDLRKLPEPTLGALAQIGRDLVEALPDTLAETLYRGRTVSRYEILRLRPVTDLADALLASALGYEHRLEDLEFAYWTLLKRDPDAEDAEEPI